MTEKLKSLSEKEKLPEFCGVKIERQFINSNLTEVKVILENGDFFKIRKGSYSDIEFLVPKPKEKKEVFYVVGRYHQIDDFKSKPFQWKYEAEFFMNKEHDCDLEVISEFVEVD